jgi:hypothetical protein
LQARIFISLNLESGERSELADYRPAYLDLMFAAIEDRWSRAYFSNHNSG